MVFDISARMGAAISDAAPHCETTRRLASILNPTWQPETRGNPADEPRARNLARSNASAGANAFYSGYCLPDTWRRRATSNAAARRAC